MRQETWYEIQYSLKGADDWFSSHHTADTPESARRRLAEVNAEPRSAEYDYRLVKATLTQEPFE